MPVLIASAQNVLALVLHPSPTALQRARQSAWKAEIEDGLRGDAFGRRLTSYCRAAIHDFRLLLAISDLSGCGMSWFFFRLPPTYYLLLTICRLFILELP